MTRADWKPGRYVRWNVVGGLALLLGGGMAGTRAAAQASSIQSAQSAVSGDADVHGRQVLDQMVTALGGDAWRGRRNWKCNGNFGVFLQRQAGRCGAEV